MPKENIRNITVTYEWDIRFNMYIEALTIFNRKQKRGNGYYVSEVIPVLHSYTQQLCFDYDKDMYFVERRSGGIYQFIEKKPLPRTKDGAIDCSKMHEFTK